jgi:hypothetical protein
VKRAIDADIEDYFTMQERKTAKVAPPAPRVPDPPIIESNDIKVEESAGQDGLDTIVEKVRWFWDR